MDLPQEAVAQIHQFVPLILDEVRHPDLTRGNIPHTGLRRSWALTAADLDNCESLAHYIGSQNSARILL